MKRFECDICGVEVKQYNLTTLYGQYQAEDIEDACEDCYKEIKTVINKIDRVMSPIKQSWAQKIILKIRNKNRG